MSPTSATFEEQSSGSDHISDLSEHSTIHSMEFNRLDSDPGDARNMHLMDVSHGTIPHGLQPLMIKRFQHLPLDPATNEIRLLRIERPSDETSPIVLTLRHASLKPDLKFTALSYVWGNDASIYPLVIRDEVSEGQFLIKQNLWTFLLEAQKSVTDWSNNWFWIDQICIDQGNDKERAQQVNQMGTLYSTAQTTIAWLTDLHVLSTLSRFRGDEMTAPLFNAEQLNNIFLGHHEQQERDEPYKVTNHTIRLLERFSIGMLLHVIELPYWRRLWVIQEIILSLHACVLIADGLWDLKDLYAAMMVIYDNSDLLKMKRRLRLKNNLRRITKRIGMFLRIQRTLGTADEESLSWNDVLHFNHLGECSVLLDRVYAVVGFLREELRVEPDYTITTDQLLKNIFEKEIRSANGDFSSIEIRLKEILKTWKADLKFNAVTPPGWTGPWVVTRRYYRGAYAVTESDITTEARLMLQEFGLPDPLEVNTAFH